FEVLPLFERGNNPEPVRLKTRGILRGLEFSSSGKYLVAITKSGMELFPAKQLASADRAGGGIRSIPVQTSGEPDGFFCTSASDTILFVALAKGDIEGFRQADGGGFDRKFLANPRTGDGELKAMVCGPDGKWIALGDSNGEITILPGIDGRIKPSRIRNEFDRWPPRMTEQWTFLKNYLDYGVSSLFFWPERNQLVAVFRQGPMGLVSMPDNAGAEPAMVYVLETQESLAELKVMADRGLARREVARKSKITAADFIPAEGRLVVGSEKSVGEWDLSKFLVEPESRWNANYRDVMILQEPIRKLKFKRDGKAVFTIDQGLNVRVVLRDGLEKVGYSVRPTWKEGDRPCLISSLRLLPGSNKLVAGGSGFLAFMEMDRDLNLKRTDEWPCFDGSFRAMSLDRDARRLALAVQTDKVHAGGCRASQSKDKNAVWLFQDPDGTGDWKMSTPAPMSVKQSKGLWSVSWSKGPWTQGRELLAASDYMGAVWIWPFGGGSARPLANSPQRLPRAESGWIRAAAFHPTEPLIALGAEDGGLEIWRLNLDAEGRVSANQLKARGWKKRGPVRALAWSPDGAILVYGGDNGKMGGIPAGPMKTGDSWEESSEFSAHTMGVTALVFCDDSAFDASENPLGCDRNTFASAGNDGKIRMWRIRETEGVAPRIDSSPKLTLEGPDSEVQSIDLSRDGRTVVAGDAKGQVHLWRIESGQLLDSACGAMRRNLSTDEWRRYVGDDIPREETCPDLPAAAHDASGSIAVRHRN
ncbi:MAG: hypothetical protein LLG06_07890, partial [Desulfobacteraceae bacterium]|nr:hypothetical protein [Desulfobacteraceae bacterium]